MRLRAGPSRRRVVIAAALLIGAGAAAWRFQGPLAAAAGRWLIVEDPLQPSDAVIALAGNTWLRVPEAVRVVQQGHGRRLLITLAKPSPRLREFNARYGRDFSDEALARLVIQRSGLDPSRVELLRGSTSTWTDAQLVLRAWRRQRFQSAILITDPYHLRRARRCFELVFAGTGVVFRPHGAFRLSDNDKIFTDQQDILQYIVTEYLRTAYYYLAH